MFRRSALWIEPLRCLTKLANTDRQCSGGFSSTRLSVQALLSAYTRGRCVNRDGQLLEQFSELTSVHVELWERSAILRLASGACFVRLIACPLSVTDLSVACR